MECRIVCSPNYSRWMDRISSNYLPNGQWIRPIYRIIKAPVTLSQIAFHTRLPQPKRKYWQKLAYRITLFTQSQIN